MRKLIVALAAVVAVAATPLHAEQKNVQLLTNLSDSELLRTMNMMRGSLGVHCDFCHVVGKDGWDFASDEKKEKKTAREMISMVLKLNKEQFRGNAVISCYTCHRGSERVTGLVPLPQTAPPFPTPQEARPHDLPALADVLKKYAGAAGDTSKWESRILRGTREATDGKSAPIAIEEADGKAHFVGQTPAGPADEVVLAESGWTKNDQGVQPLKAVDVARFHDLAAAYVPTPPSAIPTDARVVRKEKIGDHETIAVFSRTAHARQRYYFDATTGLLVRRVIITDSPIGPIPEQSDFDDWRDAGGAKYPFHVRASFVDPWNSTTRKYSEVKLGAKIDPSAFAEPK